jgi:hypothetical protein
MNLIHGAKPCKKPQVSNTRFIAAILAEAGSRRFAKTPAARVITSKFNSFSEL